MALPKYDELLQPVLEALQDGSTLSAKALRSRIVQTLSLTDEQLSEMLPSGKQFVFHNRVHWAAFYLKKAGLVVSPKKGHYIITASGKQLLSNGPVTLDVLRTIPAFLEFFYGQGSGHDTPGDPQPPVTPDSPIEILDKAHDRINSQLADELLELIMEKPPKFFEKLVVDLLCGMGYGGALDVPGEVVGRSGDEGIDGIIREDKLGFNKIYIQAKRWGESHPVSRPDIQQFVGALAGQNATKGLYITTGKFSEPARQYANSQSVILVDGQMLTRLMIEAGIGVSVQATYIVRKIDTDYFEDE